MSFGSLARLSARRGLKRELTPCATIVDFSPEVQLDHGVVLCFRAAVSNVPTLGKGLPQAERQPIQPVVAVGVRYARPRRNLRHPSVLVTPRLASDSVAHRLKSRQP
jgi:hypothetical protein